MEKSGTMECPSATRIGVVEKRYERDDQCRDNPRPSGASRRIEIEEGEWSPPASDLSRLTGQELAPLRRARFGVEAGHRLLWLQRACSLCHSGSYMGPAILLRDCCPRDRTLSFICRFCDSDNACSRKFFRRRRSRMCSFHGIRRHHVCSSHVNTMSSPSVAPANQGPSSW